MLLGCCRHYLMVVYGHLSQFFVLGRDLEQFYFNSSSMLSYCTVPEAEVESNNPVANEDIVAQLVSMGFNHLHCQKAAINTSNTGVEEAMNWLLAHMDDPGI